MKKAILIGVSTLLVLVMICIQTPFQVNAKNIEPTVVIPPIAPGSWTGGTEVAIDLAAFPTTDGLELKSQGIKVTSPGKICHEFRGISYHWVPEIRFLKNGKWVKVESVGSWVPDTEGVYEVCANVSTPGTYALFAYYNGPKE
jgi:hypothetical protein